MSCDFEKTHCHLEGTRIFFQLRLQTYQLGLGLRCTSFHLIFRSLFFDTITHTPSLILRSKDMSVGKASEKGSLQLGSGMTIQNSGFFKKDD